MANSLDAGCILSQPLAAHVVALATVAIILIEVADQLSTAVTADLEALLWDVAIEHRRPAGANRNFPNLFHGLNAPWFKNSSYIHCTTACAQRKSTGTCSLRRLHDQCAFKQHN